MTFFDRIKSWLGLLEPGEPDYAPFSLKEMPDGRLRFLTICSNNFEDRAKEYILADAHREFIEWADEYKAYPELWLWHTPGTRLGVIDVMDFDGHFLISSGLIDPGMEEKALAWATDPSTAMSHGFFKRQRGREVFQYRQYEQSLLPHWAAANQFTQFAVGVREMALNPTKRTEFAAKGWSEEELSTLDTYVDRFAQRAKEKGISFKEFGELSDKLTQVGLSLKDLDDMDRVPDPTPDPAPTPGEPAPGDATPAPATGAAPTFTLDDLRAVIREEVGVQTKQLEAAVKDLQQSDDDKFSQMWARKSATPATPASKSGDTVVGPGSKEAVAAAQNQAWVNNIPLFAWLDGQGMNGQGVR